MPGVKFTVPEVFVELIREKDVLGPSYPVGPKGQPFGLKPAGLGARDTLRTEVCYPLYGHELDEDITVPGVVAGRFQLPPAG